MISYSIVAAQIIPIPALKTTPWKSIGTLPDDVGERQRISQDAGQARIASYGGHLIDKVMKEEKPDFYFGVQDIWGTEFAVGKPWFDKINSVIWTTLDSLPHSSDRYFKRS